MDGLNEKEGKSATERGIKRGAEISTRIGERERGRTSGGGEGASTPL